MQAFLVFVVFGRFLNNVSLKFTLKSQHVVHPFKTNAFGKPLTKEGKVVGIGSVRKTNGRI